MGEYPLDLQGWLGLTEPDPNHFQRPSPTRQPSAKPSDGFFTSSWDEEQSTTPWVVLHQSHACRKDEPRRLWTLTPDPSATLYIIDTPSDYRQLVDWFPHRWNEPSLSREYVEANWHEMANGKPVPFHGIHVTKAAIDTADAEPSMGHPRFGRWDVESTLWLEWSFLDWQVQETE